MPLKKTQEQKGYEQALRAITSFKQLVALDLLSVLEKESIEKRIMEKFGKHLNNPFRENKYLVNE